MRALIPVVCILVSAPVAAPAVTLDRAIEIAREKGVVTVEDVRGDGLDPVWTVVGRDDEARPIVVEIDRVDETARELDTEGKD